MSAITVVPGGEIVVAYGGPQANAKIPAASVLTLNPGLDSNNDIIWVCGLATAPASLLVAPTGGTITTIVASYLPSSCHS